MPKKGFTYIVNTKNHTVLYTGATSTLKDRIDRHRKKKYKQPSPLRQGASPVFQGAGFSVVIWLRIIRQKVSELSLLKLLSL
jgi:hypothetical protein